VPQHYTRFDDEKESSKYQNDDVWTAILQTKLLNPDIFDHFLLKQNAI
jgi:hypothetical protein